MHNARTLSLYTPWSLTTRRAGGRAVKPVSVCVGAVAVLAITYIGLIAIIMSYAALTIEFSESVRNDEAAVAELESRYFARVAEISKTDYIQAGYVKPSTKIFVSKKDVTALR